MTSFLDKDGLTYYQSKVKSKIDNKVDKVSGKGLSTNDYTTEEKTKLSGIATGATNVTTSTVSGWGYTKNAGTITGIKMNGASKGTSGVVDLGTVVTDVSGKQDKLTSQTAYTSKGSATKVPQITTNSLGQVTGITEVTITQPTVNNATLTIQKNGTNVQTFTANASANKTANITVPVTYKQSTQPTGAKTGDYWVDTSENLVDNAVVVNEKTSSATNTYSCNYINKKFNTYSTTEQVIGTWIDGKPIYRKTIAPRAIEVGMTKYVSAGLSNVGDVVDLRAMIKDNANKQWKIANQYWSTSNWLSITYEWTTDKIFYDNLGTTSGTIMFVIEYTKTTD